MSVGQRAKWAEPRWPPTQQDGLPMTTSRNGVPMTTLSCPLVEQLQTIPDPRRQCRNLKHRLVDVLLSGFCGVLAGCDNFVEIPDWARHHEDFLRTFLELPNGIPSHDTYNRVFATARPA